MDFRGKPRAIAFLPVAGAMAILSLACSCAPRVPAYYRIEQTIPEALTLAEMLDTDSIDVALLEWMIFKESNYQRERLGAPKLRFNSRLRKSARAHSQEMVDLGYFSHDSPIPSNATLRQRLKHVCVAHGPIGENLAVHPTKNNLDVVFKSKIEPGFSAKRHWRNSGSNYTYRSFAKDLVVRWMQSPNHRRSLLSKQFLLMGIGCVPGFYEDRSVFYITQHFCSGDY